MRFKPFGSKYSFAKDVLVRDFSGFMHQPIANWLWKVLETSDIAKSGIGYGGRGPYIESGFHNQLQIEFREVFPDSWKELLIFILSDTNRTANFLALCLQNFAYGENAVELEYILSQGGSAYEVIRTDKNTSEYVRGGYDLAERVSSVVKSQSEIALNNNELLSEAWNFCYSRNPDYEKVVSRCCDFLEKYLRDIYFPNDPKPQLKKFVHAFEEKPDVLSYKGDDIVEPKSILTSLLKKASDIRGQHTGGQGLKPEKQEAEFVLHTTIYIWNLHQK